MITEQDKVDSENKYSDLTSTNCKALFENMYKDISYINRIVFDSDIHWKVTAESLFDAAFYQLVVLLIEPNHEIGICPVCHEYFKLKRKNRKYCYKGSCYPQLANKRKNSKKNG